MCGSGLRLLISSAHGSKVLRALEYWCGGVNIFCATPVSASPSCQLSMDLQSTICALTFSWAAAFCGADETFLRDLGSAERAGALALVFSLDVAFLPELLALRAARVETLPMLPLDTNAPCSVRR